MSRKINTILIIIAIMAALAGTVCSTIVFYSSFQKQVKNDLRITAEMLDGMGIFSGNTDTVVSGDNLNIDAEELRVTWIDSDGTVLYDNDMNASELENHGNRPEIIDAKANGYGESVRNSDTMNRTNYYYALLLENGTILRVSTDARSFLDMLLGILPGMGVILIVLILLSVFQARMLTKFLMKPIVDLTSEIEKAGNLDLSKAGVVTVAAVEPVREEKIYAELKPMVETIRMQHDKILSVAKSRQEFTANVSHELKTPLTAISGYAELIENDMADEGQKKHFASEIRKNSERLLALINDILRLSEMDNFQQDIIMEKTDLYQLAKSEVEELQINAQLHRVSLFIEGKSCIVKVNKDMIRELIDNLCQNAIRYNNPGGSVWVGVHSGNGCAVLTVGDNGIGIPKDQQERIFERFYRVDKSRSKATGGTGLGLSIVKHIVEIHGAKIYLDSDPGKGTLIRVEFDDNGGK